MPSTPAVYNSSTADHDGEPHPDHESMGRFGVNPREKPHIDIALDRPYLTLKGTGPDVEPTRLSGNVILYLTEATDIKEITLQFRGKARIPVPANESLINNTNSLTYVVCNHNWSLLEGGPKHTRTLKSGRHFFPFHLEIGGSLPSSITTPLLGGASIAYKLRAVAVRPLLAHNLQTMISVPLIRSFLSEALEYQQTLEIENTWPKKIMYSVVLPHKAWAIGDKLAALFKFSPLAKGVVVESVVTNILEITKIFTRSGDRDNTRVVANSRHDFIDGRPILVEMNKPWLIIGQSSPRTGSRTPRETGEGSPLSSLPSTRPSSASHSPAPQFSTLQASTTASSTTAIPISTSPSQASPTSPLREDTFSNEIVAALFLPFPEGEFEIIPSHSLEPITITHRVRWSIYIRNPDMHISELRCSLPIVVLHKQVLNEARSYTRMARRSVLAPGMLDSGDSQDDLEGDNLEDLNDVEERELPSYDAHVRDRVANMYLPETATMRVNNPWVTHGVSPTSPGFMDSPTGGFGLVEGYPTPPLVNNEAASFISQGPGFFSSQAGRRSHPDTPTPPSRPTSGYTTPLHAAGHVMSHLPHAPSESTPLDWINSELMMSLSDDPRSRFGAADTHQGSRPHSRAGSPERNRPSSRPMSPTDDGPSHGQSKGLGGFFRGAMKGFAFTKHHHGSHSMPGSPHHLPSDAAIQSSRLGDSHVSRDRSHMTGSAASLSHAVSSSSNADPSTSTLSSRPSSRSSSPFRPHHFRAPGLSSSVPLAPVPGTLPALPPSSTSARDNDAMLHRAFTEVPDYSIASKGFIGGVPPLSSMQGLPSYEESARVRQSELGCLRSMSLLANSASQQDIPSLIIRRADNGPTTRGAGGEESEEISRRVASDGDLVRRFQASSALNPSQRTVVEQTQTPQGENEENSEDDGIEMRAR